MRVSKWARSLACLCLLQMGPTEAQAEEAPRPHVVIILADDLGWRDVGYHASEIETPHLDRIAREGVELDRFYVQPTCSPTRAALMTGKSPLRLGITQPLGKNETTGLSTDERILPQYLAQLGYQTAMVGKWHLGNYTADLFPNARGFESFYGYLSGGVGYWDHNHGGGHDWQRDGRTLREEGYATRLLADEAVRVLRTRDATRPLFLYLAFGAPHLPNEAPPETVERYAAIPDPNRRLHAGMVSELDAAIGRVLATLEEESMSADTLLLFSSDNGGLVPSAAPAPLRTFSRVAKALFGRPIPIPGLEFVVSNIEDAGSDNTPLAKGKMSVAEGGVRVPAAIWWPGHLEEDRSDRFMTISDVLPTLLDALDASASIPPDLDGASQWGALTGSGESTTPDYATEGFEGVALYRAPWKFVASDPPRLYDVYADPLEERDRAELESERVERLRDVVAAWPRGVRAQTSILELLRDPDTFGGPEDRAPWADVARQRAKPSTVD